ncbi:collagen alpha-1(VIII) chain-like isoform X2 [Manacus candei]|uniref:collagen alpha-1(VIII) chain-like isoform X2 n=1 Tax=Manacus candei TaxID=415023 RepID=UPI0022265F69|nr:collagen alpha-1(VIII) chain-like isoform X2 [Manacus candei]
MDEEEDEERDEELEEPLEAAGDRVMVHLDPDCFYARVEMLRNPELKDKPLGWKIRGFLSSLHGKSDLRDARGGNSGREKRRERGNSSQKKRESPEDLPAEPPCLFPHHDHHDLGPLPDFRGAHGNPPEFRRSGAAGKPREGGGAQIPVPVSPAQIQGVHFPGRGDPMGPLPAGPSGLREPGRAGIREQPELPALPADLRHAADPRGRAQGPPLALQRQRARLPAPGLRLDRRHRPRQLHRHHLHRQRRPGRLLPKKHRPLDQEFRSPGLPLPALLQHPPGIADPGCGRCLLRHAGGRAGQGAAARGRREVHPHIPEAGRGPGRQPAGKPGRAGAEFQLFPIPGSPGLALLLRPPRLPGIPVPGRNVPVGAVPPRRRRIDG